MNAAEAGDEQPLLRIVTPDATAEEIAALVAVFAALGSAEGPVAVQPRLEWNAPHRLLRPPHQPGPAGWRSSGLPR